MPPAPPTFSITTCWPRTSPMRWARMRPSVSCGPPAANGMIMVTGRLGKSCARATGRPAMTVSAKAVGAMAMKRRLSMSGLPLVKRTASSPIRGAQVNVAYAAAQASIRVDPGGLDNLAPARDLLGDELGEILGRALLGRHKVESEGLQALADRRILERIPHRLVELAHDRLRRALGQEKRVPHRRLDARQALLARGRQIGDDRHALGRHHGDALHAAAIGLRGARLDGVAHVIETSADEVLHHRPGAAIGNMRNVDP